MRVMIRYQPDSPCLLHCLSLYYQRLGELFEELSVVSDQIHSLNPLIELVTVEIVCESTKCIYTVDFKYFAQLDCLMQNAKQAYCKTFSDDHV